MRVRGVVLGDQRRGTRELAGPYGICVGTQAELGVFGGERLTVVEGHVGSQREGHRPAVGRDLPRLRQHGFRFQSFGGIADEGVVDQSGDGGRRQGTGVERGRDKVAAISDSEHTTFGDLRAAGLRRGLVDRRGTPRNGEDTGEGQGDSSKHEAAPKVCGAAEHGGFLSGADPVTHEVEWPDPKGGGESGFETGEAVGGVDDGEVRRVAGDDAAGFAVDRDRNIAGHGHPVDAALVVAVVAMP